MTCPYCDPDARYVLAGGPCVCAPWSRIVHLAPGVTLYCGDSLEVLPALAGRHDIASVVTDPPYGLGEHPDPRELLRCWLEGRPYVPRGKGGGFMGKDWDAFVPGPEIWRPVMDLLPPGAHMLAAFGTRTYDLGTLAVRLADAEIRDLVAWLYGSGFPKSLDVSKAIDKAAGAERSTGVDRRTDARTVFGEGTGIGGGKCAICGLSRNGTSCVCPPSVAATDAAREWEGWGTALKPALEPWVLARKPLSGTVAANVQMHGVGALNINACRVGMGDEYDPKATQRQQSNRQTWEGGTASGLAADHVQPTYNAAGRWPANIIHDGSDEVLAGFPVTTSGVQTRPLGTGGIWTKGNGGDPCAPQYGDTGSASRFFYCAKASKRDRDEGMDGVKNNHPTVKPEGLMSHHCRLITPPGGVVLDPFMGSGSTGKAAVRAGFGFVGIERDPAYFDIAVRRVRAALENP